MAAVVPKITTFLLFDGKAEEAMNFYITLFDQSEIVDIKRYGANESGTEGSVMQAVFKLHGQTLMAIDSNVKHSFTFTPSVSLYVTCDTEEEINNVYARLAEKGAPLMPLASYGFSAKFGWVQDQYGVSWQLNLE